MEVTDPAHGDVEARHVALDHAAVEHDRRVGAALVGGDPVDDRVAADLLLAVTRDAQVDGELAGRGEQLRRLQEHVQLALVVGDAAGVEPAVALDELERIRVPELERVGRLHVEVPVAEDRGRRLRGLRGADLADDEWALTPGDHLGAAAGSRHEIGDPRGRRGDVRAVRRIGADGGNRDQLGELGDERVGGRHVHGGGSLAAERARPSLE